MELCRAGKSALHRTYPVIIHTFSMIYNRKACQLYKNKVI